MNTRRFSMLTSLLLTAALLYALPALLKPEAGPQRAEPRLLPPKTRTLTVWLASDSVNDGRLINELCAAYEKERTGVRIFLRRVDGNELNDPKGVPPDIALYSTGDMRDPAQKALPLGTESGISGGLAAAGMSAGACYGLPLWYDVPVLAYPKAWLKTAALLKRESNSYFELQTQPPAADAKPFADASDIPWRDIVTPGAMKPPQGTEWQQLMSICPPAAAGELASALKAGQQSNSKARIDCYSKMRGSVSEELCVYPLIPAASHRVRFASIMRGGNDARDFLEWLLGDSAQESALLRGLMPSLVPKEIAEPELAALAELYSNGAIHPNAYERTKQELYTICEDAFYRGENPALTLLKLR